MFSTGTLNSKVKWYTNHPDVISISGIFSDAGIEYDESDAIAVRLKALNPGIANVYAEFKTSTGILTSSFELSVFKVLELESPKQIISDAIIVPPNSRINLKANLPDAKFHLSDEKNSNLEVSIDGVLKTSEHIGRNLVIVRIVNIEVNI